MTADEHIALLQVKLERAEHLIQELDVAIRAFLGTHPYEVLIENNPNTSERRYYVGRADAVPPEITCIVGDAVHNLRSVLDHIVYQLVAVNGGKPNTQTCFPIFDNPDDYKTKSPGKIKGMSQAAAERIDAIKPYKGASLYLWWLHKLDIIDKHRMLFASGIRVSGHSATPSQRKIIAEGIRASRPNDPVPDLRHIYVATGPLIGVMKTGDTLLLSLIHI